MIERKWMIAPYYHHRLNTTEYIRALYGSHVDGMALKSEELTLDVRMVFFECTHMMNNFSILLLTSRKTNLTVKYMIKN